MEVTSIILGTIHGWIGAIWISLSLWKKNRKTLSILSGLLPFIAFIYGLLHFKKLWKPTLMIIVGVIIVILA